MAWPLIYGFTSGTVAGIITGIGTGGIEGTTTTGIGECQAGSWIAIGEIILVATAIPTGASEMMETGMILSITHQI
jgi:hypothetical protein